MGGCLSGGDRISTSYGGMAGSREGGSDGCQDSQSAPWEGGLAVLDDVCRAKIASHSPSSPGVLQATLDGNSQCRHWSPSLPATPKPPLLNPTSSFTERPSPPRHGNTAALFDNPRIALSHQRAAHTAWARAGARPCAVPGARSSPYVHPSSECSTGWGTIHGGARLNHLEGVDCLGPYCALPLMAPPCRRALQTALKKLLSSPESAGCLRSVPLPERAMIP
jgi:hypothetical protein